MPMKRLFEQGTPGLSDLVRRARMAQPAKPAAPESPKVEPEKADPVMWHDPVQPVRRDQPKKLSKKARRKQAKERAKAAAAAARPEPQVSTAPKYERLGEMHHDSPSLASRSRPDLPSASERHELFKSAFQDKRAKSTKIEKFGKKTFVEGDIDESHNIVFHGHMASGHRYVAKPKGAIDPRDMDSTAREWGKRHHAVYEVLAGMGAHHMAVPGIDTKFHDHHQIHDDIPHPPSDHSEVSKMYYARHHAGDGAYVQEHAGDNTMLKRLPRKERDKIDFEHRLHGIVIHTLFENSDGHAGNVLISKHGHPVLIDHDYTLHDPYYHSRDEHHRVRSVFADGGDLSYMDKLPEGQDEVGKNYPPRMKAMLKHLADGKHIEGDHAMGLSKKDGELLKRNAEHMLKHGLEGAMDRLFSMSSR